MEWRAPVIDGQVCHQWRQTILRSPRAWAYLEIHRSCKPALLQFRQWLDRSGSVPLHIRFMGWIWGAQKDLDPHCKRIKSITLPGSFNALLNNRSFPILQSLTIMAEYRNSRCIRWSACYAMPELHSLRVSNISMDAPPPNIFPVLRFLSLYRVNNCDSVIQHSSHSLTSLMIGQITLKYTAESLEFPSLRYLSLCDVIDIKHWMNVPALTTYHESGRTAAESFSVSLPFLVEYGVHRLFTEPFLNVTKLHQYYPNISRLSLRVQPSDVRLFLHSLSDQPSALPMLRILAVEGEYYHMKYSGKDKDRMRKDVFMRNMASDVKMELCFVGKDRVPLYFADVGAYINEG